MKGRSEHIVPLSTQAIHVVEELHKLNDGGHFVFGNQANHERPMSGGMKRQQSNIVVHRQGPTPRRHTCRSNADTEIRGNIQVEGTNVHQFPGRALNKRPRLD
jgi:integrase